QLVKGSNRSFIGIDYALGGLVRLRLVGGFFFQCFSCSQQWSGFALRTAGSCGLLVGCFSVLIAGIPNKLRERSGLRSYIWLSQGLINCRPVYTKGVGSLH